MNNATNVVKSLKITNFYIKQSFVENCDCAILNTCKLNAIFTAILHCKTHFGYAYLLYIIGIGFNSVPEFGFKKYKKFRFIALFSSIETIVPATLNKKESKKKDVVPKFVFPLDVCLRF